MEEPTPRPWAVKPGELDGEYEIREVAEHLSPLYSEERYEEFEGTDDANAQLIEKAVNAYDELTHLLNACHHELTGIHDAYPEIAKVWGDSSRLLNDIEKLLEKLNIPI